MSSLLPKWSSIPLMMQRSLAFHERFASHSFLLIPQFRFPRTVEGVVARRCAFRLGRWSRWWSVLRRCSFWSQVAPGSWHSQAPLCMASFLGTSAVWTGGTSKLPFALSYCSRFTAALALRFLKTGRFCGPSNSNPEPKRTPDHTKNRKRRNPVLGQKQEHSHSPHTHSHTPSLPQKPSPQTRVPADWDSNADTHTFALLFTSSSSPSLLRLRLLYPPSANC